MIESIKISGVDATQENYKQHPDYTTGTFQRFILRNIDNSEIISYAEWSLDMIETDDCVCDCDGTDLKEVDDELLIDELSGRDYLCVKITSVMHQIEIEECLRKLNQ